MYRNFEYNDFAKFLIKRNEYIPSSCQHLFYKPLHCRDTHKEPGFYIYFANLKPERRRTEITDDKKHFSRTAPSLPKMQNLAFGITLRLLILYTRILVTPKSIISQNSAVSDKNNWFQTLRELRADLITVLQFNIPNDSNSETAWKNDNLRW